MNQTTQLRYIHKDHLGSWHTITDETGTLLQELSYDAWGTRRDPATWLPFGLFSSRHRYSIAASPATNTWMASD